MLSNVVASVICRAVCSDTSIFMSPESGKLKSPCILVGPYWGGRICCWMVLSMFCMYFVDQCGGRCKLIVEM